MSSGASLATRSEPAIRKEAIVATLVRHVMTEAPATLDAAATANDAAGVMARRDVGAVPVTRDGRLAGLVTDRDIVVRVLGARQDPRVVTLGDIATAVTISASPDMELSEAREMMAEHRVRRLPVLKDGELVGIISLGDVALAAASKREVGEALEAISDSESTRQRNAGPTVGTPERARRSVHGG
jgi:CBS domain-containing protein